VSLVDGVEDVAAHLGLPEQVPAGSLVLDWPRHGRPAIALRVDATATDAQLRASLPTLRAARQRLVELIGPDISAGSALLEEIERIRRNDHRTSRWTLATSASRSIEQQLTTAWRVTQARDAVGDLETEPSFLDGVDMLVSIGRSPQEALAEARALIADLSRDERPRVLVAPEDVVLALRRFMRRFRQAS
jgi:hypothetical protein